MKYNLYINQKQAIELGIKNINQAIIFDLLSNCATWAKPIKSGNDVYYWVARQALCKELPLMNLKPDTMYRHLKALAEIGIIEHIKDGVKDLVRITEKGKSYHHDQKNHYVGNKSESSQNSEINPTKHGNKSENNSEINPTYHTTKLHHTTKHNNIVKSKKFVKPTHDDIKEYLKEKQQQMDIDYFIDYYESKDWMIGKNRMKNWKSAVNNWLRNNNKFTGKQNANNNTRKLTPAEQAEERDQWYREKYAN